MASTEATTSTETTTQQVEEKVEKKVEETVEAKVEEKVAEKVEETVEEKVEDNTEESATEHVTQEKEDKSYKDLVAEADFYAENNKQELDIEKEEENEVAVNTAIEQVKEKEPVLRRSIFLSGHEEIEARLPKTPEIEIDTANISKGEQLFLDVFHRADKREDGKISLEEFKEYFADEVMDDEQLLGLFKAADEDHSRSLSLAEVHKYFNNGFGPFQDTFKSLYKLNESISRALAYTHESYIQSSIYEQYKTRFYLRECANQLRSLHRPVGEAIEQLTKYSAPNYEHEETEKTKTNITMEQDILIQIQREVATLSDVVHQLQHAKVALQPVDGILDANEPMFTMVSTTCLVFEDCVEQYGEQLSHYLKETRRDPCCLRTAVKQRLENEFTIYQVWENEEALDAHYCSDHNKLYQKECLDLLQRPANTSTMYVPRSWWAEKNE